MLLHDPLWVHNLYHIIIYTISTQTQLLEYPGYVNPNLMQSLILDLCAIYLRS
ncbi:hypothetical protein Hanom_Chr17g01586151 [Helianthus anomalus]